MELMTLIVLMIMSHKSVARGELGFALGEEGEAAEDKGGKEGIKALVRF